MTTRRLFVPVLVVAACIVGAWPASAAEKMPVNPDVQASLFKRIFDYDRTLKASGEARVLVLHDGRDFENAEAVVRAFRAIGIKSVSVPAGNFEMMIDEGNVVYLTPEARGVDVAGLCEQKGMLTVSGVPELVESGQVAIGIGGKDDDPEILVHLARTKTEQHELSSELLSLARVIR